MVVRIGVVAAVAVFGFAATAQTLEDLQAAIDAAEPGSIVYVENDMEFSKQITVNKALTIQSAGEATYKITRASGYVGGEFITTSADTDLVLKQLEINGNPTRRDLNGFVFTLSGGKLTLDAGFRLVDFKYSTGKTTGAITIHGGSELVMLDGAEIRGLEGGTYATVVCVGDGGKTPGDALFTMKGGLITDCHHTRTTADVTYGGMVYTYGGRFNAYGGLITGNTSDTCVGGVNGYSGNIYLSGSFTVTNNAGPCGNDLVQSGNNTMLFNGAYTGLATYRPLTEPEEGGYTKKAYTSSPNAKRAGLPNITSELYPDLCLDGQNLAESWYPVWTKIAVRIGERKNALTIAELKSDIRDGDVIRFYKDFDLGNAMSIEVTNGVHVTLTSGTDEPCVLRRNVANMSLLQVSGGSVRVENLIWDGNRENFNDNASWGFLLVTQGGELVLGKGTVISNSSAQAYGAAAIVRGTGSRLVMEDGALITDCHGSGNSYGSTVMIGTSGTAPADPKPIFEMRGGLITGCSANSTGLPDGGYSGIVYTWSGGVFLMSGGKITGNTSNKGSPGVVNYLGTTRLTGDAYIEGNDGPYPGIYNCSTYITTFFGDFRGCAPISSGVQDGSEHLYVKAEDEFATGAWCFYPAFGDANLVGSRVGSDLRIYWKPAIGSVSGVKAASAAELKMIIPSTLDLTAESFDLTKLPFVLSGAACDLSGEIALAFDSRTLSHSGALPLSLIAPAADETLTGSWSFTMPSTARGNWQVVSRATEGDYALTYSPASSIFQLY